MAKSMNVKKIVVKPSPLNIKNGLAAGQQIIVLPSNLLQQISGGSSTLSQTGSKRISQPAKIIVPASAANLQRQIHSSTNVHRQMSGLKRECEEEDDQPARKRANLDHLTPEEKLMRRKLKNRVAAQNARDKKRVKMDDMEEKIKRLEQQNKLLMEKQQDLIALSQRLMKENEILSGNSSQNIEATSFIKIEPDTDLSQNHVLCVPPLSPESLPRSPSPSSSIASSTMTQHQRLSSLDSDCELTESPTSIVSS